MGVSDDLLEELYATILHNEMEFSRLMVHAQKVYESDKINMDTKRSRPYDGGTS